MIYTKDEEECFTYVDESVSFLKKKMNLGKYNITIIFSEDDYDQDNEYSTPFSVKINKTYRVVTLYVYPAAFSLFKVSTGRERVFDALVHEMCHVITCGLGKKARDRYTTLEEVKNAEEITTEDMAGLLRPFYFEEFNKLNTKVCEVKKQPSKKVTKQINKSKAK